MKKYRNIIALSLVLLGISGNSQTVKRLNDEAIVSQHKRQVFERWGDWRPYGKYFLGVQTNFAYATIWGWLSPSINQKYKNGADIRPLKLGGIEMQRYAVVEHQRKQAEKIKVEVDTIHKRNMQDFAHWTSTTVSADPLWLLYYKRMLAPLERFPEEPQNYLEWGFKKNETYETLKSVGAIESLQEQLNVLKDKYKQSRTMDMPRGKRFIMYHETLIGWRALQQRISSFNHQGTLLLDYKDMMDKFKRNKNKLPSSKTDMEIIEEVMETYKNRF